MDLTMPLLLAGFIGFSHAFEADHLVAVSNLVTRRQKVWEAAKDGLFWGLGHTSTIFIIGILMLLMGVTIREQQFTLMEAFVGLVLIALGLFRLRNLRKGPAHTHGADEVNQEKGYKLAYGVGLVHGLAGSGAVVLLVMTEIQGKLNGLLYLLIFGLGSILGMLLAAGVFSLPFSRKVSHNRRLQKILILVSSALCIGYGGYILVENLGG